MNLTTRIDKVSSVRLVSATVPNTLYNITNGSNVFAYNSVNYSINPGYYSGTDLAAAITVTTGNNKIGCTYFASLGKLLFWDTISFTIKANTQEFATVTGLTYNQTYTGVLGSTTAVYAVDPIYKTDYVVLPTSISIMQITPYENIYLDIQEFRSPNYIDSKALNQGVATAKPMGQNVSPVVVSTASGLTIEGVTGIVPLDVTPGSIKTFKGNSEYSYLIQFPTPIYNINKLTIRWIDSSGNVVNFNGSDHNSFVLQVNE